jgi:hypothetical protein
MKHVTFNDTTYIVMIENKDDIEDKNMLWWTYLDYYRFLEYKRFEDDFSIIFDDEEY